MAHLFLSLDDSSEQIIKSTVPCEDSESKTWQAIIEYTCSVEEAAYFRGMSHCHVLLGVSTPLVCSRLARDNILFLVLFFMILDGGDYIFRIHWVIITK